MIDKDYCASSYLAFRYIEKDGVDFAEDLHHENIAPVPENEEVFVTTVDDIDTEIQKVFESLKDEKLGILLSGGMDSASLASYMPGADAYTFRFVGGSFQKEELKRAEYYAEQYSLNLHYVEIDWDTIEGVVDKVLCSKGAPVHSIEPQLYLAAMQAKQDGVTCLIVGESADLLFGGMDQLLAKDWTVEEFTQRYTFLEPEKILKNPIDTTYLFERYRQEDGKINFLSFMDDVFSVESSSAYLNAFATADIRYVDPYAKLRMAEPLDLNRVRNGEPKYLIRSLFAKKYPDMPVPNKVPMPRPVDHYFAEWEGPSRPEFRSDIAMNDLTGNQKWQIWCLERFLNRLDEGKIHQD